MAKVFINNLAVYPLVSILHLPTSETGVEANARINQGTRPIVRVYYKRIKKPLTHPYEMDLNSRLNVFIDKAI